MTARPHVRGMDGLAGARRLLGVRPDASAAEVRSAFRARVRVIRPDLGGATANSVADLLAARDLLVLAGGADRRRPGRRSRDPRATLLRRSTWQPDELDRPELDVRL